MANVTFNVNNGETIGRELLIAYLNTGTHDAPVWSPVDRRVNDSSAEYDWGNETEQDIIGNTFTSKKKPVIIIPILLMSLPSTRMSTEVAA